MAKQELRELGWWGRRWLEHILRETALPLSDGQLRSARTGVARVTLAKGGIRATVETGVVGHAVSTLKVRPLSDREWRKVLPRLAADTELTHRVLSGNLGAELEAAFAEAGASLFPKLPGLTAARCNCREQWGCRHLRVLLAKAAEMIDENPFLWFEILGRTREELQAFVQGRLADQTPSAGPEEMPGGEDFWETSVDPDAIPVRPGSSEGAESVLRMLGPVELPASARQVKLLVRREVSFGTLTHTTVEPVAKPVDEVLREYVGHIGRAATALATGAAAPRYLADSQVLPGKPVPLAQRLSVEVATVVADAGEILSIGRVRALCPTVASLADDVAAQPLLDACRSLPQGFVLLAGKYVGTVQAVLAPAAFRHVVTFDEVVQGRLNLQSDWARALALAGIQPPSRETGDVRVGDEFWIAAPHGQVTFRVAPREQRELSPLRHHSNAAARHLMAHLDDRLEYDEAVGLLLGAGEYRPDTAPDPVWLLPAACDELQSDGIAKGIRRRMTLGPNAVGGLAGALGFRWPYAPWREQENALRQFAADLEAKGQGPKQVERALTLVKIWCAALGRPQDLPDTLSLPAFLRFLWVSAPRETPRYGILPDLVPRIMADWFTSLQTHYGTSHDAHLQACRMTDAYEHRVRTAPPGLKDDDDVQAWQAEGYRWIGIHWKEVRV